MRRFTVLTILILTLISGVVFAEDTNPPSPPAAEAAQTMPAPPKIDTGDTAWMIVATAFVMLMTLPGLALFYGGLAKRKDTLNTMAILTGIFADPAINEAGKGLLYGNPGQLLTQLIAVVVTIIYSGIMTLLIFMLVKAFVGVRVEADHEITGLDESQHGEKAYSL